jgi:acetoin utilization deacetylase AcuC-like enzyme
MMTSMPDLAGLTVVTDPATQLHVPGAEIWVGVRTPGTELPERVEAILDVLVSSGADPAPAEPLDASLLDRVHAPELLDWLATAHDRWVTGGYADAVGQDRVVPYVFPTAAMMQGLPPRPAAATHAEAGRFCYDTMTLVGPGTWPAVQAAAAVAHSAAGQALSGAGGAAYGLCRPPGHHATRDGYGGSCYVNNAAVAAEAMLGAGIGRVAIIDIDAHHGNGTQAIFYDRDEVFYGSVHVDPGAGWFPHFVGYPDETGVGRGAGWNRNRTLAPGTGDEPFIAAVAALAEEAAQLGCTGLVVSLGVDAAGDDPESPLKVTPDGFGAVGQILAGLGMPTAAVQEGGYHLDTLGALVAATLEPFAERARSARSPRSR